MREFKILAVIIVFVGVLYYGVEPYAHSVMHPATTPANFEFKDLPAVDLSAGNAEAGKALIATCTACHGIKAAGMPAPMDAKAAGAAYGVVPPDLSDAGLIYDARYLVNFIEDPNKASLVKNSAMPSLGISAADATNIVAYLKSIAPKKLSDKEVFVAACARCHAAKYGGVENITPMVDLKRHLFGITNPKMHITTPDLSMMIRARGAKYLHVFINDPQKELPGTMMPRVGLTKAAQTQVVDFLYKIGDSKKGERDALGWKIILFVFIMVIIGFGWKRFIWRDLH